MKTDGLLLLNIYNNQKQFLLHQPRYLPGGQQGVKTFILMKLEGEKNISPLCFSPAMEELNVERAKSRLMGAHIRQRGTCSVRPSERLKLLSLTDCINKGARNKRGLSVYIAQLPRC